MSKNTLTPFKQALLDATLEEFADIPDEDEIETAFSEKFISETSRLVQNSKRKSWHYVNTIFKRAILVAAVIALLATTALAIPPVREAIIRFFVHDEGTYFEFSFDLEQSTNVPELIETVYCPTYILDDYDELFRSVAVSGVIICWADPEGREILFSQYPMQDLSLSEYTTGGGINSEGTSTEFIYLDGYEVFRIEDNEVLTYVWTNHEYYFSLMSPGTLSEEEIQKIFLSVQIDENAVIE